MKTLTKILLTLSISLFFIGVVMCGMAYVVGGTDLSKMDFDTAYEENTFVSEASLIKSIEVNADKHDIIIKESAYTSSVTIKYYENQYDKFVISENSDSIYITNKDSKNAFIRFFCLLFDSKNKDEKSIIVTVPQRYSGSLVITCSDADVTVDNIKSLETLSINNSDGDVVLDTLICTDAVLEIKTGDVSVLGGTYSSLNISAANPVQYKPIDKVDPELWPSGIIMPSVPTLEPTISADSTLSPIETPTADDNTSTDAEQTPDSTPTVTPTLTPTDTPKAPKTPSILVVEASVSLDNVDVERLTLNTVYTNIEGSLARGEGYYNIKTNNETSSNIATNNNSSAVGSIDISQKEGKTALEFK